MNFFLFMLAGIVVTCIVRWGMQMQRRNAQTWDSLVARLQPGWNSPVWAEAAKDAEATPEERWRRVRGATGLCTMYHNAKVMQEMADFAVRHNSGIDPTLLAELRSDALQVRMLVLLALGQYAIHQLNEEICIKTVRAASTYLEMSVRMAGVLQMQTPALQLAGAR